MRSKKKRDVRGYHSNWQKAAESVSTAASNAGLLLDEQRGGVTVGIGLACLAEATTKAENVGGAEWADGNRFGLPGTDSAGA
jgi:hypothetical protein